MKETTLEAIDRHKIDYEAYAIDRGAIIYSHTGNAKVRINFDHWDLANESVLIFFPGDVIKWEMADDNFTADIITYSSDILRTASLNIEHAVYDALKADRRCGYPALIKNVVSSMFCIFKFYFTVEHYSLTDRIVTLQLQAFFIGYYDYLQANPREELHTGETQRRNELFNRFMELLEAEYRQGREVNYYAQRIHISRKYLGIIVSGKTGVSPKRIIDEYVLIKLKLALRISKRSLKQIAADFSFPDQSALTRYFRNHAGISPQQYRLKQ